MHQPTKESLTPGLSLYLRPDLPLGNLKGKHSYELCRLSHDTHVIFSFITFYYLELIFKNYAFSDTFESDKLDLYKISNMPRYRRVSKPIFYLTVNDLSD